MANIALVGCLVYWMKCGRGGGVEKGDIPHYDGNSKGSLGLLAEPFHGAGVGDRAALRDVPWCPGLWVLRIAHVGAGLAVDADGIEGSKDGVDKNGDDGGEGVGDVHDRFDEEDEHGEDGDDDVVVGYTACDVVNLRCTVV